MVTSPLSFVRWDEHPAAGREWSLPAGVLADGINCEQREKSHRQIRFTRQIARSFKRDLMMIDDDTLRHLLRIYDDLVSAMQMVE